MKIQEIIAESYQQDRSQPDLIKALEDFLPLALKELDLKNLPKIKLEKIVADPSQPTFGKFVNNDQVIHLGVANRHPLDILRTLAHELVHYKQFTQGNLPKGAGDTGSAQENQAHEIAGVIMRHFNKMYPHYFKELPLEIKV